MRQLVQANTFWANDHQGYSVKCYFNAGSLTGDWWTAPFGMPIGGSPNWYINSADPAWCADWYSALNTPYLKNKQMYKCPSDPTNFSYKNTEFGGWPNENDPQFGKLCNFPGSYRINYSNQPAYAEAFRFSRVKCAFECIIFAEGTANTNPWDYYQGLSTWYINTQDSVGPTTFANVAYKRHGGKTLNEGKSNYAFLDGHVETMTFNMTWRGVDMTQTQPVSMWRQLWAKGANGTLLSASNP
ncbi:MAG: hypothetical protein QM754_00350 [Tepidisphaeraceae bacterium]